MNPMWTQLSRPEWKSLLRGPVTEQCCAESLNGTSNPFAPATVPPFVLLSTRTARLLIIMQVRARWNDDKRKAEEERNLMRCVARVNISELNISGLTQADPTRFTPKGLLTAKQIQNIGRHRVASSAFDASWKPQQSKTDPAETSSLRLHLTYFIFLLFISSEASAALSSPS